MITRILIIFVLSTAAVGASEKAESTTKTAWSKQTQECLECHRLYHPGLVADWEASRHAHTLPENALKLPVLQRRISAETVPDHLAGVAVGCFECHSLNADRHPDNFEHFGHKINLVVTPNDCQTCHPVEAEQYAGSKKAHASVILDGNAVYHGLVNTLVSVKEVTEEGQIVAQPVTENARNETCFACHGSKVEVIGKKTITTDLGELEVPALSNWPNQGVGRINPDGSRGACTACHPRHSFSIEIARKPHTCSQCHMEPDVPAWNVYRESKHGNIYDSKRQEWNWTAVPWKIGADFRAPTCAACHNSMIASPDGEVIVPRTHDFGARLWVRIFGLPYSHPQPKQGDTTLIRNKDGQPMPTALTGEPAFDFLIDKAEQHKRQNNFKKVCQACHGQDWVNLQMAKLEETVKETDRMTLAATRLLQQAQKKGLIDPKNLFDEPLEQKWVRQWMFYANSVRYGTAMMGADHATFKNGWWNLTENLQEMKAFIDLKSGVPK
jgi:hypothetical protein